MAEYRYACGHNFTDNIEHPDEEDGTEYTIIQEPCFHCSMVLSNPDCVFCQGTGKLDSSPCYCLDL